MGLLHWNSKKYIKLEFWYTWHIRSIFHVYTVAQHIHGIYLAYTNYIPHRGSRCSHCAAAICADSENSHWQLSIGHVCHHHLLRQQNPKYRHHHHWTLLTVTRAVCVSTGGPHPAGRSAGYNLKSPNKSAMAPADTIIAYIKQEQWTFVCHVPFSVVKLVLGSQ